MQGKEKEGGGGRSSCAFVFSAFLFLLGGADGKEWGGEKGRREEVYRSPKSERREGRKVKGGSFHLLLTMFPYQEGGKKGKRGKCC